MNTVLKVAAIYNILFGLMTLVDPFWIFDWAGAERPNYPELWQCIGMIVGVYGLGYWIASYNPLKHWPIVFVGWLGKIFGPIGFLEAVIKGVFPLKFGWTIVFNDLIWWWPFTLIVWTALRIETQPAFAQPQPQDQKRIQNWIEASLSGKKPQIVFFMRHAGCTFCREALERIHSLSAQFQEVGAQVRLVHMGSDGLSDFAELTRKYSSSSGWVLEADQGRALYQLMGLSRGTWNQIFSLKSVIRALQAGVLGRKGVGALEGDGFMMPGVFVWQDGKQVFSWKALEASESFPYEAILQSLR